MNPTNPEQAYQPLAVEAGAPLPRRNPAPAEALDTCCGTLVERMLADGEDLIDSHAGTKSMKRGEVLVDCNDDVWTVVGHDEAGDAIFEHDGERETLGDMAGLAPFAYLMHAGDAENRGVKVAPVTPHPGCPACQVTTSSVGPATTSSVGPATTSSVGSTREAWQAEADDITPQLAVGADVVWFDIETGKTDPMPGKVFQILADQEDAFPIVVRWNDGALYRHARNELRVVTA